MIKKQCSFRYAKKHRLLKANDFKIVFDNFDLKIHQSNLLFFIKIHNDVNSCSRLGLAITKKKIRKANNRNNIKRLTREYFRLHQNNLIKPVDMILVVKHFSVDLSNDEIVLQLQQVFKQINYKLKKVCLSDNMNVK